MKYESYSKYKDSGAEWLGDVPEAWAVVPLKSVAAFSGGGTPSRDRAEYWQGHIPWVSPKDMKWERITSAEESITKDGLAASSGALVPSGALLMVVRSGILQHTIPVAINSVPVSVNQDIKVLAFNARRCSPEYFLRLVQGHNDALLVVWGKQGATVESIEHASLANTRVPLPSIDEQDEIVRFLDQETAKIDALIEELRRLVELLQERRAALISAAVTGKIDVRNYAPQPALTPEPAS